MTAKKSKSNSPDPMAKEISPPEVDITIGAEIEGLIEEEMTEIMDSENMTIEDPEGISETDLKDVLIATKKVTSLETALNVSYTLISARKPR